MFAKTYFVTLFRRATGSRLQFNYDVPEDATSNMDVVWEILLEKYPGWYIDSEPVLKKR
jgi:hypothetical protein